MVLTAREQFPTNPLLGTRAMADEPEKPDIPLMDTVKAAFNIDNTLVSMFNAESGMNRINANRRVDPTFDPFENIDGYEEQAISFARANTPEDVEIVKRQIDKERRNREIVSQSGATGVASSFAAGIFDPVNLVPVGGAAVKAYKSGGSILKGAATTAAAGLTGATVAESLLQASQETRTLGESAINISGATILSGVLGGAVSAVKVKQISRQFEKDLVVPKPEDVDLMESGAIRITEAELNADTSVGAAKVKQTTLAEEKLVGAYGIENLTAKITPALRTATSHSVATRRVAQRLSETPFTYEKNALGIATPTSVETRVKMWDTSKGKAVEGLDRFYVEYKQRVKGTDQAKLSFDEFKEQAGKAMRRGDTHEIPEVQKVAQHYRKTLFDPLKNRAIEVDLLPEDVRVGTADSYLTRVWNKQKIRQRRPELKSILVSWLRSFKNSGDFLGAEDVIADNIIETLLGNLDGRILYELPPAVRTPLKERTLSIRDELIEDFLDSDIELVGNFYHRTMAPDVEIKGEFGSLDMEDQLREISDDYSKMDTKGLTPKEKDALGRKFKQDQKDILAMRDRLRGTYGMPENPDSTIVRAGRVIRQLQFLSKLGGMTVSSFADLARPIMTHGISRTLMDGIVPMVKNFKKFKISAKEAKEAGTAWDMVLDTRAMSLADINDITVNGSRLEKGLNNLSSTFGKVTLMTQWNTALKQFSGVVTQGRIIRNVDSLVKGKISTKQKTYLASIGIDDNLAKRIDAQLKEFGDTYEGNKLANTQKWTDKVALKAYRAALVKEIDKVIVTPGIGDRPLWMSNEVGKMLGQFKSFAFAANQKVLIAGLQQSDAAFLSGAILAVGMGMVSSAFKYWEKGQELPDDPRKWISEGIDRSGLLAVFAEVNNISEKSTRGKLGLNSLLQVPSASRYQSRNISGALFGPTIGTAEDFTKITGGLADEWTKQDTRALRRVMPYQNLLVVRRLFDEFEEGLNESLGVRK